MGRLIRNLRAFPNQSKVERLIGEENLATIMETPFYAPIPIVGVKECFVYDGMLVPRMAGGGFSSLSDLISEATAGAKRQSYEFNKVGATGVIGQGQSLWATTSLPASGATPANIPGGTAPTSATIGAFGIVNPAGGDTLHFVSATGWATAAPNVMLVYDRLFHAANVLHSTAVAQPVSGVPTRYQNTTVGTADSAVGNFAFLEVTTVLTATAFNIQIKYQDQNGNTVEQTAALAGVVSSAVTRLPHVPWFIPLNTNDNGLINVSEVLFSAAAASGISNICIGHPLVFWPFFNANEGVIMDGINSTFNLTQIFSNACVSLMELKGITTGTNYAGQITLVSG